MSKVISVERHGDDAMVDISNRMSLVDDEEDDCNESQDGGFDTESASGSGPSVDGKNAAQATETKAIQDMAKAETNKLRTLRMLLLMVMLTTGALVANATYMYLSYQESNESLASVRHHFFTSSFQGVLSLCH